jgi:hypothetical protein
LKFIILFLCIQFTRLFAQNYLWPTDASTYLSSSFCEFRNGHYHSAIDIKTWLREGYKCFAIEDGEISRIRISPFGYGKVLYLKLKDGNTAVYAHLQHFPQKIESQIRKMQLADRKYSLDWAPVGLKVKKGDIVAYTGRTGTGVPHLHFEIRNVRGNPVNPLAYYSQIKDTRAPTLQQIAVIPLSSDATVNNSFLPQVFDLERLKDNRYRINGSIFVHGTAGIALRGVDRANDVGNKYGFYQTTMRVNEKPVFQITYNELDFSTTGHIFTEIYYPLWIRQGERFHKLYHESFNPLPFYTNFKGTDGTITIADSALKFEVEVTDFFGNLSTVSGRIEPSRVPYVQIRDFSKNGGWVLLKFNSEPFTDLTLSAGPDPKKMEPVKYFEISSGKISEPENGLKLKISLDDTLDRYLQVRILTRNSGEYVSLITLFPPDPIKPSVYLLGDRLLVQVESPVYPISLRVNNQNYAFQRSSAGKAEATVPVSDLNTLPDLLTITAGEHALWSDTLYINRLMPREKQKFSWFDSALTITSGTGTVIEPFLIQARRYGRSAVSDSLPLGSDIYEIDPATLLFFDRIDATLQTDSLPDTGTWSLFRVADDGKLSYEAPVEKVSPQNVSCRIGGPGRFIVACDTIPPRVEIGSPQNGRIYDSWPAIRFHLDDRYSDIGSEDNISILIDGKYVIPEWDPEDKTVEARIDYSPTSGSHTLTISVSDRSKNVRRQALMFTIR